MPYKEPITLKQYLIDNIDVLFKKYSQKDDTIEIKDSKAYPGCIQVIYKCSYMNYETSLTIPTTAQPKEEYIKLLCDTLIMRKIHYYETTNKVKVMIKEAKSRK